MRPGALVLSLSGTGFAQRFTFGKDCSTDAQTRISDGMTAAVGYAKTALMVLKDFGSDSKVQDMCKFALDDGKDYNNKLAAFKAALEGIEKYDTTPDKDAPDSKAWLDSRTNKDVEFWCSKDQAESHKTIQGAYHHISLNRDMGGSTYDEIVNCHDPNYKPPQGSSATAAFTLCSDSYNQKAHLAKKAENKAKGLPPPNRLDFCTENKNVANVINMCEKWYARQKQQAWKDFDPAAIKALQTPAMISNLAKKQLTPIDLIHPADFTLLHELSHTTLGGRAQDTPADERNGVPGCYGWSCVEQLKKENNADTVAMLTLALNLWSKGWTVDKDGKILDK